MLGYGWHIRRQAHMLPRRRRCHRSNGLSAVWPAAQRHLLQDAPAIDLLVLAKTTALVARNDRSRGLRPARRCDSSKRQGTFETAQAEVCGS